MESVSRTFAAASYLVISPMPLEHELDNEHDDRDSAATDTQRRKGLYELIQSWLQKKTPTEAGGGCKSLPLITHQMFQQHVLENNSDRISAVRSIFTYPTYPHTSVTS